MTLRAIAVPQNALLHRYVGQIEAYTDCFETLHPREAALGDFIEAFYGTWLFRLERLVLTFILRRRITEDEFPQPPKTISYMGSASPLMGDNPIWASLLFFTSNVKHISRGSIRIDQL